jgi:hypothetical protein
MALMEKRLFGVYSKDGQGPGFLGAMGMLSPD